jgi:hypothetical protein
MRQKKILSIVLATAADSGRCASGTLNFSYLWDAIFHTFGMHFHTVGQVAGTTHLTRQTGAGATRVRPHFSRIGPKCHRNGAYPREVLAGSGGGGVSVRCPSRRARCL